MRENATLSSVTVEAPIIYPPYTIVLGFVFALIFIVLGVFGNGVTVLALTLSKKLRSSPTSIFILSLCVTDLIFCSFNLPLTAVRYAKQRWILGTTLCKLFPFFFYLNVAASLFNMTAVTINRYVLIAHYPSYDKIYRRRNIAMMIFICWLFPLALLIPTLLEKWGRFGYSVHTFSCTVLRDDNGKSPKKFFFLLGFFLPCVVIVLCYAKIICIVRSSRIAINGHAGARKRSSVCATGQVDELALTRMVAMIFCAFIACYLPLMLVNVFDDKETMPALHVIASVLAWSASVVNPAIYGLMSSRYRQAYKSILPCCSSSSSSRGRASLAKMRAAASSQSSSCGERPRSVSRVNGSIMLTSIISNSAAIDDAIMQPQGI